MSASNDNLKTLKPQLKYIYDLPYPERRALTQLLDADGKWEDLGGLVMKLNQIELSLMGQARYRNESPTNQLLEKFGQRNGTIDELFVMLAKIEHYRAMQIILQYVDPKYHNLLIYNSAINSQYPNSANFLLPQNLGAFQMTSDEIARAKFKDDPKNIDSKSPVSNLARKLSGMGFESIPNENCGESLTLEQKLAMIKNQYSQSVNGSSTGIIGAQQVLSNQPAALANPTNQRKEVKKLNIPVSEMKKELPKKSDSRKTLDGARNDAILKSEELPQVMQISHLEILKATNNFDESRILGRGGFGIVYKGVWKGVNVAIKRLTPKNKPGAGDTFIQEVSLKQSLTEMRILNSCRIDNILPLYGVCLSSPEPCIVYQFMINGSLEDRLLCKDQTEPLNWTQRAEIADGTAKGLNYLHSLPDKPLVHGDIKTANILLDSDMKAKIGDFGLAREGPGDQYTHIKVTSVHGTQVYLPPEYLRQSHLSPKVDVYSYGIVLLEICTGLRAYSDRRPKNKLLIDHVVDTIDAGLMESLRDPKAGNRLCQWFDELMKLGQKCSQKLKSKRPDMSEVLKAIDQARQLIIRTENIRKLSRETGILPQTPQLSPLELQVWYDVKNGPDFLVKEEYAPKGNLLPPTYSLSPAFTTFHPSQIRAPPSCVERDVIYNEDSSCIATAGSESNAEAVNIEMGSEPVDNISSHSQTLPCLTILGTKPPPGEFAQVEMSELGPTPHPSGVVSDSPSLSFKA